MPFFVEITAISGRGEEIIPVMTKGILVVKHRLIITSARDQPIPTIWYKDVGGREHTIDMAVTLVNAQDALVTGRVVPLKLFLTYENGQKVPRQDILRINQDSKLMVDETGKTVIRFRIEEVSRCHQRQHFCIRVLPDTENYPLTSDVSPAITPVAIEVRSKVNPDKKIRVTYPDNLMQQSPKRPKLAETDGSIAVPVLINGMLDLVNVLYQIPKF